MNDDTIIINTESIAAYSTLMKSPALHGFSFPPLNECLIADEVGTTNHILYKEYVNLIDKPIPKVIFYIVMIQEYGPCNCKVNGLLGYKFKILKQNT